VKLKGNMKRIKLKIVTRICKDCNKDFRGKKVYGKYCKKCLIKRKEKRWKKKN